jgi:hypothetical protein
MSSGNFRKREEPKPQAELEKHIYKAYVYLRLGLFLLALGFPFLLWGIGSWNGIRLQNSMSEFYFAFAPTTSELHVFPVRGLLLKADIVGYRCRMIRWIGTI